MEGRTMGNRRKSHPGPSNVKSAPGALHLLYKGGVTGVFHMDLTPTAEVVWLWGLQLALIVAWRFAATAEWPRLQPSWTACFACIACGWGLRLGVQWLLASGGFVYYWGDAGAASWRS